MKQNILEIQKNIIPPIHNFIKYFGRWDFLSHKKVKTSWGASYFKIKFKGTNCIILLQDENNEFEYSIDGGKFKLLITEKNKQEYELEKNLVDDIHTLFFTRRSHCLNGNTIFKGFVKTKSFELLDDVEIYNRKMEFIGDSITAGCLNESKNFKAGQPETGNKHNENTNMAFGPILARNLKAEYSVIAIGGIGIYHNWLETIPGTQLHINDYFLSTNYNPFDKNWDFSKWQPDAVVVAIGTNDFGSEPIPDKKLFIDLYYDFIKLIREKYKNAFIFCVGPWKYEPGKRTKFDDCREYIKIAVEECKDKKIIFINSVDEKNGFWLKNGIGNDCGDYAGDNTHPVIKGHEKIAEYLKKEINKYLNW